MENDETISANLHEAESSANGSAVPTKVSEAKVRHDEAGKSPVEDSAVSKASTDENGSASDAASEDPVGSEGPDAEEALIPIRTIEAKSPRHARAFVPHALADDPFTGDGSAGRDGVEVSPWRLHVLSSNRLFSVTEPYGHDRASRMARRAHQRSRRARDGQRRKNRKYARVAVAFLLCAAMCACVYVGVTYALEEWGGVSVPYVMGNTLSSAKKALREKGFKVSSKTELADTVSGHVVDVKPAQGSRVEEGSKVVLTISEDRVMPEVVGLLRDEATKALEKLGAEHIHYETRIGVENQGKVVESRPAAGATFMSTEEIALVVSELPRVADVVGEEEALAIQHLEHDDVTVHVKYERGDANQRMRVIRTTPEAGQTVGPEGVTAYVGDPLISVVRVSDYFDAFADRAAAFLQSKGYTASMAREQEGHVLARFEKAKSGVSVSFTNEPWTRSVLNDKAPYSAQVMNDRAVIEGVRLTASVKTKSKSKKSTSGASTSQQAASTASVLGVSDPTVGEGTAREIMEKCGFDEIVGSCTQANVVLPKGTTRRNDPFYCCFGEVGKHVWTILIKGVSGNGKVAATEVVVTCAPKSAYGGLDLQSGGEKVCDYMAYQDIYGG